MGFFHFLHISQKSLSVPSFLPLSVITLSGQLILSYSHPGRADIAKLSLEFSPVALYRPAVHKN